MVGGSERAAHRLSRREERFTEDSELSAEDEADFFSEKNQHRETTGKLLEGSATDAVPHENSSARDRMNARMGVTQTRAAQSIDSRATARQAGDNVRKFPSERVRPAVKQTSPAEVIDLHPEEHTTESARVLPTPEQPTEEADVEGDISEK